MFYRKTAGKSALARLPTQLNINNDSAHRFEEYSDYGSGGVGCNKVRRITFLISARINRRNFHTSLVAPWWTIMPLLVKFGVKVFKVLCRSVRMFWGNFPPSGSSLYLTSISQICGSACRRASYCVASGLGCPPPRKVPGFMI